MTEAAKQALRVMDDAHKREVVTTTPSETAAILSMVTAAAQNPNTNVETMRQILELHKEMRAQAAEQAFNVAMAGAQAKLPRVVRDAENTHTRSRYARLETISRTITPIITDHGFSMSFGTDESPREDRVRVTCRVGHIDGHARDYHADVPVDGEGARGNANKTATHAFGSSLSYARRYLTLLIFNIAMANEDDDGNGGRQLEQAEPQPQAPATVSAEQIERLRHALEFKNRTEAQFCKYAKIGGLADLLASDFDHAMKIIGDAK